MTAAILLAAVAMAEGPAAQAVRPAAPVQDEDSAPGDRALLEIHRVYVDRLRGGETAPQMRELIISALQNTRLFVITENQERADAVLRGAAEDLLYTDKFSSAESVGAHANAGTGRSTSSGSTRAGRYGGISLSDNESTHLEERKHEALAVVRLVNKDGDVIWSTTQESAGGKFRGASADVASKIARQLAGDVERARKVRRLP